jgi:ketosteroid isomerase-like protein
MPERRRPRPRSTTLAAALAGATAAAATRAAYAHTVRAILRRNAAALMDGDPKPLLRMYAPDATMVFPGAHSWGATYRGRDEIEAFLRRFHAAGLRGELGAIFVEGPPWATRIAIEFDDHACDASGTKIYENRALIVLRTRWGRVVHEELFEDTQKVAAFDEHLGITSAPATATAQPAQPVA